MPYGLSNGLQTLQIGIRIQADLGFQSRSNKRFAAAGIPYAQWVMGRVCYLEAPHSAGAEFNRQVTKPVAAAGRPLGY
jgi:hypothetical protein